MKGKPQVMNVSPIFTSTKLTLIGMASLEEAAFYLLRHAQVEDGSGRWK